MDKSTGCTLFVRNLPYSTTHKALEKVFSETGPVKSCFVVCEKGSDKCKGYGFVKFTLRVDAEKAKEKIHKFQGRKLLVHFADKKVKLKKKNKPQLGDTDSEEDEEKETPEDKQTEDKVDKEPKVKEKTTKPPRKSPATVKDTTKHSDKHKVLCIVVVKNFDPKKFKKCIEPSLKSQTNVCTITYPVEGRDSNVAHVLFASKLDAMKGSKALNKVAFKGGKKLTIQLLVIEQAAVKNAPKPKQCRLIIRNLSFKCREPQLKESFKKFGEVTEVSIPKKPDGKMKGFGFVQYKSWESAKSALQGLNAKPFLGRPIAVDWALSKDKYIETINKGGGGESDSDSSSSEEEEAEDAKSDTSASGEEEDMEEEDDLSSSEEADVESADSVDDDSDSESDLEPSRKKKKVPTATLR